MKNIKGGLEDPPPGCFCYVPVPMLPAGGLDPDCMIGSDPQLYCPAGQMLGCC
ncbi:MAG: hypothetical protein JSU01_10310 [Bacteroidetes bacterium]|nr:hypothetical protein [Bacteroidota bacterium]